MLWSIDSCQNKVSADHYHVAISRAHMWSSSRSRVYVKLTVPPASWTSVVKLHCKWRHVAMGHVRLLRLAEFRSSCVVTVVKWNLECLSKVCVELTNQPFVFNRRPATFGPRSRTDRRQSKNYAVRLRMRAVQSCVTWFKAVKNCELPKWVSGEMKPSDYLRRMNRLHHQGQASFSF